MIMTKKCTLTKGVYFWRLFVHTKCYSFRAHFRGAHNCQIGIIGDGNYKVSYKGGWFV